MNVASIAVSGLRAADTQLQTAATNIANANTPGFKQKDVVQSSDAEGGVRAEVVETDKDVSPEEQLVKADIATYNFQANLKVLQKQKQMDKSLLDIQA
jgi:flagellar hook-associated protein FlgK